MASFSKDIKLKYGVNTYEETKKTYEWIEKSAKKWGGEEANISISFLFYLGDIRCTANSIKEFTEFTFGAHGYKLSSFWGHINKGENRIYINYLMDLSISADSKADLEKFLTILETTSLDKKDVVPITYIESQVNIETQNNGTIVQGDNNTVVSQSSNININTDKKYQN